MNDSPDIGLVNAHTKGDGCHDALQIEVGNSHKNDEKAVANHLYLIPQELLVYVLPDVIGAASVINLTYNTSIYDAIVRMAKRDEIRTRIVIKTTKIHHFNRCQDGRAV